MNTFRITLITSILLIGGGFFCPPMGVIDGSLLTAVGLLLAFATLAQVPLLIEAAQSGRTIRLQKGDLTISAISSPATASPPATASSSPATAGPPATADASVNGKTHSPPAPSP